MWSLKSIWKLSLSIDFLKRHLHFQTLNVPWITIYDDWFIFLEKKILETFLSENHLYHLKLYMYCDIYFYLYENKKQLCVWDQERLILFLLNSGN